VGEGQGPEVPALPHTPTQPAVTGVGGGDFGEGGLGQWHRHPRLWKLLTQAYPHFASRLQAA
jgi:hypothetical protein